VDGIVDIGAQKVFVLRFTQASDPDLIGLPFFATFDPQAAWFTDLKPAPGTQFPRQTAALSTSLWRATMPGFFGLRTSRPAGAGRPGRPDQARSNRSRFITLSHAATKSRANFSFASSLA
jgi:hypothetical protein